MLMKKYEGHQISAENVSCFVSISVPVILCIATLQRYLFKLTVGLDYGSGYLERLWER